MTTPSTLAAFDGGGIFFFIMIAVVGFINWLNEQKKKKEQQQPPAEESDAVAPYRPVAKGESEQERLRRFLEALGVPGAQVPPPQPQPKRQAPLPPPPPSETRNVPTLVQRTTPPPRSAPPPIPVIRPSVRPAPRVAPMAQPSSEGPESSSFQAPVVAVEYDKQSAMADHPRDHIAREARLAPQQAEFIHGKELARPGAKQAAAVSAMLRSPASLRQAFVLREVLGPPPGLQS